jgi:alkanesulfonate monooxygenase SsuD/methylene tetrahydromethanopterin reductase-like flavin-dependent oxidoreductase (luciferase family)
MNALLTSPNTLKLGLFGMNGAPTMTTAPDAWRPEWSRIVEVAKMADKAGFEASLGWARWKGFLPDMPDVGIANNMDPFAWAAGLSQVTSYTTHIATVHGSLLHPVFAAKLAATVDQMSGGRFAINLVGGWNAMELAMFGIDLPEHDARYDQLEEWVQVLKRLWTEKDEFDFDGDFYHVTGGMTRPQPLQNPIPIINAGASGRGLDFATTHAEIGFTVPQLIGRDAKENVDKYRAAAAAKGRDVQIWTYCAMVQRDSKAEAEDYLNYITVEHEETALADAWQAEGVKVLPNLTGVTEDDVRAMRQRFVASSGSGPILLGTATDIADQLEEISDIGIDGVLLLWPDFTDGVRRFVAPGSVLAELERRGLREPFRGAPQ